MAQGKANSPQRDKRVRYWNGGVSLFTGGAEWQVVYGSLTGAVGILPSESAKLLSQCTAFKTLEEHARERHGGSGLAEQELQLTQSRLEELADWGFLITDQELFEHVAASRSEAVAISSMCIPTCKRVDALSRCLRGYIDNCHKYGRTNDFVVMDDTDDSEVRKAYREMLALLKERHNVDIKYGGFEEKRDFSRRLLESGDLPPDVVEFALFGEASSRLATYGANQNSILLHTIGDAIFCADDDTICRIAVPSANHEGVAVGTDTISGQGREQTWLFPSRDKAIGSVDFVDACVLEMHEQVLGQDLAACMAAVAENCKDELETKDIHFYKLLASGGGLIRVTLNGLLGDCCDTRPSDYLFLTGPSHERLTRDESEYRILRTSRQCLRVADRITIRESLMVSSTFLGLDNRDLLPPLLPVGSGQDTLFGQVLSKCFYGTYYARLPWALLHEPIESRRFLREEIFERRPAIGGISQLIGLLARTLRLGKWKADPAVRLRILGSYLEELGCLRALDFRELLSQQVWQVAGAEISRLERAIEQADESRQSWVADVRVYLENRRAELTEKCAYLPYDLCGGRDPSETMDITQKLVLRFGQLLQWWPDIVESARRLRLQGYALAKPI